MGETNVVKQHLALRPHLVEEDSASAKAEQAGLRSGACCVQRIPIVGTHILVVDDDPTMRELIASYLTDHGFRASTAATSKDMDRIIAEDLVDLVVLDLQLAEENGLQLVNELRTRSNLTIIVITGHWRDEVDRIVGLELGADDYLTKPFNLRELLARVRAVLRRAEGDRAPRPVESNGSRYRFAGWELNLHTRRLISPTGASVELTAGEFSLLTAFLRSPQQVLRREQLLSATHLRDEEVFDRSIDVQILRLRRKLEIDPTTPELIKTERGVGYVFAAPVQVF
jgi:two-component system OmpR family response regulator